MKLIGKLVRIYGVNMLTMLVSTCVFYLVDVPVLVRAALAVSAGLVIAHVLPTWFIGHAEFDREDEAQIAFVYEHAGPVGFGGFFGSGLAGWHQGALTPEGFTWSMAGLTLIAALVSMSYWGSGTMSRKFLFDMFFRVSRPTWMAEAIIIMKFAGYHNRARKFMWLIVMGDTQGACAVIQAVSVLIPARKGVWEQNLGELSKLAAA